MSRATLFTGALAAAVLSCHHSSPEPACDDDGIASIDIIVSDEKGQPLCTAEGHILKTTPDVTEKANFEVDEGQDISPCVLALRVDTVDQTVTFSLQVAAKGYQLVNLPDQTIQYGDCGPLSQKPITIPVTMQPSP